MDFGNSGSFSPYQSNSLNAPVILPSHADHKQNQKTQNDSSHNKTAAKIQKVPPVTYHSRISGDKNAIKLCISKSSSIAKKKKHHHDGEKAKHHRHKSRVSDANNNASALMGQEQSRWANELPVEILYKIFHYVFCETGTVPSAIRLSTVCRLWNSVATDPRLWKVAEIGPWTKQKFMSDQTLHWILANRLTQCEELNLNDWKAVNISQLFLLIKDYCPNLKSLSLGGWIHLTSEQLKFIVTHCQLLHKIDLSSINPDKTTTKSAINLNPLISFTELMGQRLTSLILSHNKISGLSQIVVAISNFCPNLELLDLSNIKTFSHTASSINIEKLQEGCQKIKVFRITNSHVTLALSSLSQQAASPGFPLLEELSMAGLEDELTISKYIDDDGLDRMLKSSHKLRLLDIRGCTKITGSALVKIPAWDIHHLFLSASSVSRCDYMGLALVVQKWSHSLIELDLAWTNSADIDAAVFNLAETPSKSPLRKLDLCGSIVTVKPIQKLLQNCHQLQSINLQSCRSLPRGMKRLYQNADLAELRTILSKTDFESSETDNDEQQQLQQQQ